MSAAEKSVDDQLADFVDVMMFDAMDRFLAAVTAGGINDEIEDAVSAWRDRTINDGDHACELVDLVADVITDAVRQLGERQEKRSAIRITRPDGSRLTTCWLADDEDTSNTFDQSILSACHDLMMALRADARGQHDDLSIMVDAAKKIELLRAHIHRLTAAGDGLTAWLMGEHGAILDCQKWEAEKQAAFRAANATGFGTGEAARNRMAVADEIDRLRAENARLLYLMAKAHAVMRETGWQLAPASIDPEADGVLELAAAEIENEFADVLSKPTELETNAS